MCGYYVLYWTIYIIIIILSYCNNIISYCVCLKFCLHVPFLFLHKLQNSAQRKAPEDISQRPTKFINTGIKQAAEVNVTTKDIENIRKSIYRARRSVLPPLPRSIEDTHDALDSCVCKSNKGGNFLLVNNWNLNIILFSCKTNLVYLCGRQKIFVDGTFDFCPRFFTQMFTIHTVENGHYIPLVYILLQNKHSHFKAFQLLPDYCNELKRQEHV